jgi:hypothetical protein
MTTATKRRGRPRKIDNPATEPESPEVSIDTSEIPPHPPITPNGFRDEALREWFTEYYPDLATWIYLGRVSNTQQP